MSSNKSKEWLLYNAVAAWMHNYAQYDELDLIPQYRQLLKELEKDYEQSNNTKTQRRGRPAKRQRTKKATGNPSSTEESKTTNQET